MFCVKCGTATQDGAAFCANCGAAVAAAKSNASVIEANPQLEPSQSVVSSSAMGENRIARYSPAAFGLILICFFLPFTNISCRGEKGITFTGVQFVTGTTIEQPDIDFDNMTTTHRATKIPPEPYAILAFVAALLGLGLYTFDIIRGMNVTIPRGKCLLSAVIGGGGLICLLLLKAKIDGEVLKQGEGMLLVEYCIGFWLVLTLFLFAIGINIFLSSHTKNKIKEEGVPFPSAEGTICKTPSSAEINSATNHFYYAVPPSKQPKGPVAFDELLMLETQGILIPDSKVICEGEDKWSNWSTIKAKGDN